MPTATRPAAQAADPRAHRHRSAGDQTLDRLGVQCFNVATAYTAWRAVAHGEPVISRIVTVTGNVAQPRNYGC